MQLQLCRVNCVWTTCKKLKTRRTPLWGLPWRFFLHVFSLQLGQTKASKAHSTKPLINCDNLSVFQIGLSSMCHVCPKHIFFSFLASDLDFFEGDINLLKQIASHHTVTKRNARRSRKFLWRDKKVPYVISQELSKKYFYCFLGREFYGASWMIWKLFIHFAMIVVLWSLSSW